MTQTPMIKQKIASLLVILFLATACAPLIGPYSPTAYENATSLKAQTLALMDKAEEPYSDHQKAVESLVVELQKAYEYVRGVPNNSFSARQWEILIKKDGDLFGKFISRWRDRTELSQKVIVEYKSLISDAFDEIICLEANKKEASRCGISKGA